MKPINQIVLIIGVLILTSCCKDNDPVVTDSVATSAQFYKSSFSLAIGGREKVMLVTEPENAVVINAEWNSSDTTIAKVDSLGIVTAIKSGEATISLTAGNNISGGCTVNVIESPISGLVMPDAKYPVAKDGILFIQGTGFTENSKIILRHHTDFKSTNGDEDILAQIQEQTMDFLSFYVNANPGSYNIVLAENSKEFDFGNIEVETLNLQEYKYDKKKIFWEDTHWRWFQLRGKVKEMKVNYLDIDYRFNEQGYLTSYSEMNGLINNDFSYDNQNRWKQITETWAETKTSEKSTDITTYSYGNHNLYVRTSEEWGNVTGTNFLNFMYISYGTETCDQFFDGIWIKDLTGIKKSGGPTIDINVTSDSIVRSTFNVDGVSKVSFYYSKNNQFPSKILENNYVRSNESTLEFSSTGVPNVINDKRTNGNKVREIEFIKNNPFHLYSSYKSYLTSTGSLWRKFDYSYDKNWNITECVYSFFGNDNTAVSHDYFYYNSYDSNGNWTQCTHVETTDNLTFIWFLTRDITYW